MLSLGGQSLPEAEVLESGAVKLRRLHHHDDAGRLLRRREYSLEQPEPQAQDAYYHYDGRSSVSVLTDQDGGLLQRYHYLPFGEAMEGGDSKNRYRFAGKERLDDAELVYFGARWLATEAGRWMAPDPVQLGIYSPQALNRYMYVRNNPLSDFDVGGAWGMQDMMDSIYNSMTGSTPEPEPAQAPAVVAVEAECEGEAAVVPTSTPTQLPSMSPAPEARATPNPMEEQKAATKQADKGMAHPAGTLQRIGVTAAWSVEHFVQNQMTPEGIATTLGPEVLKAMAKKVGSQFGVKAVGALGNLSTANDVYNAVSQGLQENPTRIPGQYY